MQRDDRPAIDPEHSRIDLVLAIIATLIAYANVWAIWPDRIAQIPLVVIIGSFPIAVRAMLWIHDAIVRITEGKE